jgi:hypothetical protein
MNSRVPSKCSFLFTLISTLLLLSIKTKNNQNNKLAAVINNNFLEGWHQWKGGGDEERG